MSDLPRKAAFAVTVLPALLRASLRLYRLNRRHDLAELTEHMARVPAWRFRSLANPRYLEASVHRLSRHLPPSGLGPCLKRSLLLVDLWSRCGLEPQIHLGAAKASGERPSFHAWTTSEASTPTSDACLEGYTEIWSYPPAIGPAEQVPEPPRPLDLGICGCEGSRLDLPR